MPVLGLTLSLGYLLLVYAATPGPGRGAVVAVDLPAGAGPEGVAERLRDAGLLDTPRRFSLYAWALGASDELREGRVLLRDDMGPRTLLRRVARGHGATELRITVPEGYNRFDIARLLERWGICGADAFVAATADGALLRRYEIGAASAEGYLFPDTYQLRDDMGAKAVAARLLQNGQRRLDGLRTAHDAALAALADEFGWTLHEVLTLASVVELEAAAAQERPVIAGVFLNRLRDPDFRPHRLQADPTVSYGCHVVPALPPCAAFDGRRVTRRMTADRDNPYNTYRHDGLPPGPIGNPGLGSLRAVLAPARHGYFYFVARGDGRHAFSATLDAHNAAVRRYR